MSDEEILELAKRAILVMIDISLPVMLVGLLVGVSVALLQALTQVQEITLVFVPKILAIVLTLFVLLPTMAATLISFTQFLADQIVGID